MTVYHADQVFRGKGPLGAIRLVSWSANGWVVEMFDYATESRLQDGLLFIQETGERINVHTYLVQGDDPLAPFQRKFYNVVKLF